MNMPVVLNTVVTPYRPPAYMTNPMINQPIIYPDPNLNLNPGVGIVQGYPTYPGYSTYPIIQQEPILPTIQVQAPSQTTIIKERYLPSPAPAAAPIVHCHSSSLRFHHRISTPNTIINKITNTSPIINTPPPRAPTRHIHIDRTKTMRFPKSTTTMINVNSSPQPVLKPAIKTITTINRTTKRTTTKGNGRR